MRSESKVLSSNWGINSSHLCHLTLCDVTVIVHMIFRAKKLLRSLGFNLLIAKHLNFSAKNSCHTQDVLILGIEAYQKSKKSVRMPFYSSFQDQTVLTSQTNTSACT